MPESINTAEATKQVAAELAQEAVALTGQSAEDAANYTRKYAPLVLRYGLQLSNATSDVERNRAERMLSNMKSQAIAEGGRLGLQLEQQHLKAFLGGINKVIDLVVTAALPALATAAGGPVAGAAAAAVVQAMSAASPPAKAAPAAAPVAQPAAVK